MNNRLTEKNKVNIDILIVFFNRNKILILIIALYSLTVLSQINWGIPNINHPFDYHMDEWAQSQSIRAVFKHGTPNVPGASHGTMFHYFLGGLFLIPFILFHIVNPFIIKNSLQNIAMQHRLFEILRLNTLIFGIFSIITLAKISKSYLKINPVLTTIFFTLTPIFLALSNYFKYDIDLIFWILFSIFFLFRFSKNPTAQNFYIAGLISGISLAVKISAAPLAFIYILSFFLYIPKKEIKLKTLLIGILIFSAAFFLFGIPDIFFRLEVYREWFHSNLVSSPQGTENFNLGFPNWELYLLFEGYPSIFGHIFFAFSFFSFFYLLAFALLKIKQRRLSEVKKEIFLLLSLLAFVLSMISLKIGAAGNRALVLLPFFALISGLTFEKLKKTFFKKIKFIFIFVLVTSIILQLLESYSWLSTRLGTDPRVASSKWIEKNLPKGTNIGIENVPIFQYVPDIALQEFYQKQYFPKKETYYNFYAIDSKTKNFPQFVFINNIEAYTVYQKNSDKKVLLEELKKKGYKQIADFSLNLRYYKIFNSGLDYYINAIMASPLSITAFKK